MTRRCKWCGCFVAAGTEPTVRAVYGHRDGIVRWRTFSQLLCPPCSDAWSTDQSWNRTPTPAEAGVAKSL